MLRRSLKSVRAEHDDPELPDEITERDLAGGARMELKTLTKENAEFVARHLAMASIVIDSDPELAHRHAVSASRRGGRIAMVRETLAITAYATGDFALALRELRTYRRISGSDDQLALMIDSERGLGRPDRALELGRSVDLSTLSPAERVNVAIAMSGARLDQGKPELALAELEIEQLDERRAFSYSPALFAAYAEVLTELGRDAEATRWASLAERAERALDAAAHDEHETVRVVTEPLEGAELEAYLAAHPEPVEEPVDAHESVDVDGSDESVDVDDSADVGVGAEPDRTDDVVELPVDDVVDIPENVSDVTVDADAADADDVDADDVDADDVDADDVDADDVDADDVDADDVDADDVDADDVDADADVDAGAEVETDARGEDGAEAEAGGLADNSVEAAVGAETVDAVAPDPAEASDVDEASDAHAASAADAASTTERDDDGEV